MAESESKEPKSESKSEPKNWLVGRFEHNRVGIFVDVQNLYYAAKNLYKKKVDYATLLNNLLQNRKLVRCIAYVVQRPDISQDKFIDTLSRIGYEVHVKTQVHNRRDEGGKVIREKVSYELLLAIDAIQISSKLDTIILVTGDGTYVPLVQYLQNLGCKVEVAGFERSTSRDLINIADKYIRISPEWTFEMAKSPEEGEELGNNVAEEPLPDDNVGNIIDSQPPSLPSSPPKKGGGFGIFGDK